MHRGDHRLREIERRLDVHLEHDPAPLVGELGHRHVDPGRGIVHEHVDRTAQCHDGFRDDPEPVGRIGEIGRQHNRRVGVMAAARQRLVQTAFEMVVLVDGARRDHHGRALGGEPLRDAGADAAARAGDDRATAVECTHVGYRSRRAQTRSRESMLMALPRRILYATSGSNSATIFSTYSLLSGQVVSECG